MDVINFSLTVILVLFVNWGRLDKGCQATRIDISPDKFMTGTDSMVHISCGPDDLQDNLPDDPENKTHQTILIKVYKAGEHPIVFLQHDSSMVKRNDVIDYIEATGYIGQGQGQSYLNVTLTTPGTGDSGTYTCSIYYLTYYGELLEDSASRELVVEKLDVYTLETILKSMNKQISSLETRCDGKSKEEETDTSILDKMELLEEQNRKLTQRIDELASADETVMEMLKSLAKNANKMLTQTINDLTIKAELMTQRQLNQTKESFSQQLEELKERVTFVSAFSATNLRRFIPVKGGVLVFPDVTMQQGQGYNPKTGIFTAPKAGVYYFNLLILIASKRNFLDVYLKVNNVRVASMGVGDDYYNDQSSIGAVVQLNVGDKVNLVVANMSPTSYYINEKNFSQFSGFLVSAV